jgi:hypothetical protein
LLFRDQVEVCLDAPGVVRANLLDLFFDPGIPFRFVRLEIFPLCPLDRFISIQRVLAAGGVGEQFVD